MKMIKENVDTNGTIVSESTTLVVGADYQAYCQYRLPCGYCTKLDKLCPMVCAKVEPTWKVEPNWEYVRGPGCSVPTAKEDE